MAKDSLLKKKLCVEESLKHIVRKVGDTMSKDSDVRAAPSLSLGLLAISHLYRGPVLSHQEQHRQGHPATDGRFGLLERASGENGAEMQILGKKGNYQYTLYISR